MSRKMLGPYLVVGLALLGAPLAGSSPGRVSSDSQAPPPSSSGGTLTGTISDPTGAYLPPNDFLKFTITGADLKRRAGTASSYLGTSAGKTITLSGQMSVTIATGYVSYVNMSARIGTKSWAWPPKGEDNRVTGRTVTQNFNLTFKVGVDTPDPGGGGAYVSGEAKVSVCGGICAGYSVDFIATFTKLPTTTPTTPAKPKPKPKPTGPPKVQAFAPSGAPAEPGKPVTLQYSVTDPSRKATVHLQLYQGGTQVGAERVLRGAATGKRLSYTYARLAKTLTGPLFFCVWAENAAGKTSAEKPRSSCAWVPLLVNVKSRDVSNGCGGKGWDTLVEIENYFGNVHTYEDLALGTTYTVDFTDACDLHDAGYGGLLVKDKINGGKNIDYRTWSRMAVDAKFWNDMKKLCHTAARPPMPAAAVDAMEQCEGDDLPASIGSETLYNFVNDYGDLFFDADLVVPDVQEQGNPKLRPAGGARGNGPPKCNQPGFVGEVHRRASSRCSGTAPSPTTTTGTPGSSDRTAPTLLVQGWSGKRGQPVVLRWRAKDASGRVSFVIEVSESVGSGAAGKSVYKKVLPNRPVDPGKYTFFSDSGWKPGGKTWYRLCVQATDPSGNTSKDCQQIKIA